MKMVFNISNDGNITFEASNEHASKTLDNKRARDLLSSLDDDFYYAPVENIKANGKDIAIDVDNVLIRIKNFKNIKKNHLEYLLPLSIDRINKCVRESNTNNKLQVISTKKAKKYVYIAGLSGILALGALGISKANAIESKPIFEQVEEYTPNKEIIGITSTMEVEILENNRNTYVIPSDIYQTGISQNNTYYDIEWDITAPQREIYDDWRVNRGESRGIATLDDRYLIALSPEFGTVGDYVDIILEDDTLIPAIIADVKAEDREHELGHLLDLPSGRKGVDIVEWEILTEPENIKIDDWRNKWVKSIINYTRDINKENTVVK